MAEHYKYRREDFGPMQVKLNHLTLYINFLGGPVEVTNLMDITAMGPLRRVELDAKNLEIREVEWVENPSDDHAARAAIPYVYESERNKLVVDLPKPLSAGQRFGIRTVTLCTPSDHILEGIYKDVTPRGAPQQYMSQCQQWGFQRIAPIFDDCRAKCTFTTTIEADSSYVKMISNGNICAELNPKGVPVPKPGFPGRQIIRYRNDIPMPPYLFLVCVGTWDTLTDSVTYDSGESVQLECLVPPGRIDGARVPMEILKHAVLWTAREQDYRYTADTYRTICMTKSNFGGMENMGNTTIVTDAALVDEHTMDQFLLYAHGVIVHEFEHNQCGSETTMETPFDVWLNEAYTVDVERQFMADFFDPTFVRLTQVDSIRSPLLGPLAIEDSGRAGRIVREGFDDPDDLIDSVTYVKAAEVIRMLRLILGADTFKAAKNLYFKRYRFGNANTDQFFDCFEEVSGKNLDQFKRGWLYTPGYPNVTASTRHDSANNIYQIDFHQRCSTADGPFHIPIHLALVDGKGQTIPGTEQIFQLTKSADTLQFSGLPEEPAFASLNRDYSFYGTFTLRGVTSEKLTLQTLLDTNPFNRVEAMRRLTDWQRIRLLTDSDAEVSDEWLDLYGDILTDGCLPAALKAYFLRIDEQPLDREYFTWYRELVAAREKLILAVNRAHRDRLIVLFRGIDTYGPRQSPRDGIEDRILKNVLLDLIATVDSFESHGLILDHYRNAVTATDRVAALVALNRSSAPERRDILEQVYQAWHGHVSGYANYLRVVSSGTCDDVFDMIQEEKLRSTFDLKHPTWSRALLLTMAANNKMVWSDKGIEWVARTVIELAPINGYVASRLLNVFQMARKLRPAVKDKVHAALRRIVVNVPEKISPTVHNQAKEYLGEQ